jgi:16S rRNA (adenine(1408)-N(1))-methyltransferase
MGRDRLEALAAQHESVTLDLGAGDGKFAYRLAVARPELLVIAVEPVRENIAEMSAKAAKNIERGGVTNVVYVCASVEQVPKELERIADEVLVTLPWGSLMKGILLGDRTVLAGITKLGRRGATIRIVFNARIFDNPVPNDVRGLPDITPLYARDVIAPAFAGLGVRLGKAQWMEADEVARLGTTWAKRLSHRSPPRSFYIEAKVMNTELKAIALRGTPVRGDTATKARKA